MPPSRSVGRAAIASKAPPSSTSITIPVSSQPSLATRRICSNRPILKFQICLARYQVGTMIELPRAALRAGEIAETAEFFSFGTNDLTQTTFGISRDDAASFLGIYTS